MALAVSSSSSFVHPFTNPGSKFSDRLHSSRSSSFLANSLSSHPSLSFPLSIKSRSRSRNRSRKKKHHSYSFSEFDGFSNRISASADYYSTLGIPTSATIKEIKAAYRKLARQT